MTLAEWAAALVATAPPLSAEQRDRLAVLLRPVESREDDAA